MPNAQKKRERITKPVLLGGQGSPHRTRRARQVICNHPFYSRFTGASWLDDVRVRSGQGFARNEKKVKRQDWILCDRVDAIAAAVLKRAATMHWRG